VKNTLSLRENLRKMKPIGWMILISDLIHGFIDGLTVGAISMISISECLRMMVPIACEEFSHKLGKKYLKINLNFIFILIKR
jgi:zinc transporter ZupT